jgi:hypothetical protein
MRDVQLPIDAKNRAIGIDHRCGIEVASVGCGFEDRNHDDNIEFLCQIGQDRGRFARHGFGEMRRVHLLFHGKVPRAEEFLQTNHASALFCRISDAADGLFQIGFKVGGNAGLDERDPYGILLTGHPRNIARLDYNKTPASGKKRAF